MPEVEDELDRELDRLILDLDAVEKMKWTVYLCCLCHKNRVHPENGEDTCSECLSKQ